MVLYLVYDVIKVEHVWQAKLTFIPIIVLSAIRVADITNCGC